MEEQKPTEQSSAQLTTSRPSTPRSRWIGEQLTILAEALGEPLTRSRLRLYAADLADLEQDVLASAFVRARQECRFFPKIAELRELAIASRADLEQVEANAAWEQVIDYCRNNWHPDLGHYGTAKLPARCEYALRQCGGLAAVFNRTIVSEPFLRKRFDEHYRLAPIAEQRGLIAAPKSRRELGSEQMPEVKSE
jgi:hypothetical protein